MKACPIWFANQRPCVRCLSAHPSSIIPHPHSRFPHSALAPAVTRPQHGGWPWSRDLQLGAVIQPQPSPAQPAQPSPAQPSPAVTAPSHPQLVTKTVIVATGVPSFPIFVDGRFLSPFFPVLASHYLLFIACPFANFCLLLDAKSQRTAIE